MTNQTDDTSTTPFGNDFISLTNLNLSGLALAIVKRPWVLVLTMLVVMVPLVGYVYTMVPIYQSSAMVMRSVSGRSFMEEVAGMGDYFGQEKTDLYYTSILGSRAFFDSVAAEAVRTFPDMPPDSVDDMARSSVSYSSNSREEGFLDINAVSETPDIALSLAQIALEQFRYRCIELEREDAIRVAEFIDQQIGKISSDLGDAERALQNYIAEKNLVITDLETGITGELLDLEKKLSEAEANYEMIRINVDSYTQQISKLMKTLTSEYWQNGEQGSVDTLRAKLESLRERLKSPEASRLSREEIKALMDEMDRVRTQMINQIAAPTGTGESGYPSEGVTLQKLQDRLEVALIEQTGYQNQIYFYNAKISQFKQDHPNLSEDILELARLTRSKGVLQSTLEFMLEKRETAKIRVALEQGGIQVIDQPRLPTDPISRGGERKILFGLFVSVFLGVAICVLVDRLDNSVREEEDVKRSLGLPVFGTIPMLKPEKENGNGQSVRTPVASKTGNGSGGRLLTFFPDKSPVAEAYRSLKITLQFEARDKGKKVFVVSSPSASEGKSLTSANLGISFAQGGKKTLILDADLRRAVQHRYFELDRKPGLTNYLLHEEASLSEIIHSTGIPNLSLITSGSFPPNPAELLASQAMKRLLNELRTMFDIVLIDSPPVTVCSDPLILGEITDGIIVIAKTESTQLRGLAHAVNMIRRLHIEIMGVVLNQAEMRYGWTYYYIYRRYRPYSYYGYSYTYGHGEEEAADDDQRWNQGKSKRT